jgi:hypothetical protein
MKNSSSQLIEGIGYLNGVRKRRISWKSVLKYTSFHPKPGVNLAYWGTQIIKATGIFSWQMLYQNQI